MRLIANGSQYSATLPTPAAASGTPGYANNNVPAAGQVPTILYPDDLNIILAEMMAILAAAGISPDNSGSNTAQLLAALKALTFGTSGQALTNMTSSRMFGATYTNSTGRAIWVSMLTNNCPLSLCGLIGTVGGGIVCSSGTNASQAVALTVQFIVPPGATYAISNSGTGTATLGVWWEYR